MDYIGTIKYAILFFPLIAFIFTLPFILSQYHKYGSISLVKSFIIYSFIFYLISAYFLVILPLPKISEVAAMATPTTQLIPFEFVIDFLQNTSFVINDTNTYLKALKESYFYVPLFNVLLTLPLGMFIRYLFKCDFKKTVFCSFLLSLFFELTQLSGLYFIYPRGYRLFDVDDLILNTLGGALGYVLYTPFTRLIPKIDTLNEQAKEKGRTISGLRRTMAKVLDLFIFLFIETANLIIFQKKHLFISIVIYFIILPIFLGTSTPGEKFLNIEILDYEKKKNYPRLLLRKVLFILMYILLPYMLTVIAIRLEFFEKILIILLFIIFYTCTFLKYVFSNKDMLYERLSKTKLSSTIK